MARVKTGPVTRARHNKVLKLTKGHQMTKHRLFRRANESMLSALKYSTRDRKNLKRDMRRLWITRINAGARQNGTTYSKMMYGLKLAGVDVNRKMLSEMAISDPAGFTELVHVANQAVALAAESSAA